MNPKVLLMDEPCSALDPIATMKIEELIHSSQDKLTMGISDFTAFFSVDENKVGCMMEFGTTAQIFSKAMNERTRDDLCISFG